MRFHQVLNDELGCASYLLADHGEAIVVDPRWDVDIYLELAAGAGAQIIHVVETHDHADHVSGRGRLTRRTGALAHRPHRDGDAAAPGMRPGDELRAGRIRMTAIATPGHRPEHLSLLVSDGERDVDGWCLLAGDSLLVGDVARPDLAVAAEDGARDLHASVQRIFALGDHVELWPAHIGGSLCGGGRLSAKTSSTIGFERRAQAAAELGADAFVTAIAARTPPRPPNIARIVALNQGALDAEPAQPAVLDAAGLQRAVAAGATVLDVRPAADFDALHLRGALALGTRRQPRDARRLDRRPRRPARDRRSRRRRGAALRRRAARGRPVVRRGRHGGGPGGVARRAMLPSPRRRRGPSTSWRAHCARAP